MISRASLERRIAGAIRSGFDAHEWSPKYLSSVTKRVAGELMPLLCNCPIGIGTVHRITGGDRESGGETRVNVTRDY